MRKVFYKIEGDYIILYSKNKSAIDSIDIDDRFSIDFQLEFWAENNESEDTIIFEELR